MGTTEYLTADRKAIGTTVERSKTLLTSDGYTIEPFADRPGVYCVMRGENDSRPLRAGESLWNDVDIVNQECSCRCFEFRGICKHLLATNKAVAEAARLMAPMLPAVIPDTPWPPADRAVETAFPTTPAPKTGYGSEEWQKMVAADFG